MTKWVIGAAVLGFLIGVFWMVMAFVFFTAEPQGVWWTLFSFAVIITCPAWFLFPFTPIANAGLYALVATLIYKARPSSSRAAASPEQSQS
jgi:hypothetical protein